MKKDGGTFVVFSDAYIKEAKKIPVEAFVKAISKYGKVLKPTLYHTFRGTSQLNGNRFCILDIDKSKEMPNAIKIRDESSKKDFHFNLWWPNKPKICYRCGKQHTTSECPEMKEFYAVQEERAKREIH